MGAKPSPTSGRVSMEILGGGALSKMKLKGTSKNRPYSSDATKLPANDSVSFVFRFINVHSEAVSDRQRKQFFEVPMSVCFPGSRVLTPSGVAPLLGNSSLKGLKRLTIY